MKTIRFPQIYAFDIHIGQSSDFCKRFGKKVKKFVGGTGGRYTSIRGNATTRYVTVPCNPHRMTQDEFGGQLKLIDQIIDAYRVDCIIVHDSFPSNCVHDGRPRRRFGAPKTNHGWKPKRASEYIQLARVKHLKAAEECGGMTVTVNKAVFVIGETIDRHYVNSMLYNLYARAWRKHWRDTVDKVRRVARKWKVDIIGLEVVSETAERASGSAERERSRGR